MTEAQMLQYVASLNRVRALYTGLLDAPRIAAHLTHYERHLGQLDKKIAVAEMHLSARRLAYALRAGELNVGVWPVAEKRNDG